MAEREIEVSLLVTFQAKGRTRINLADYDEWRGDKPDTEELVAQYLTSDGDGGWDVQGEIYEDARKRGTHDELSDSDIVSVRFLPTEEATR